MGLNINANRIGSNYLINSTTDGFLNLQREGAKVNDQVSTGLLFKNFTEQGTASVAFLSVKSEITRNETFIKSSSDAISRIKESNGIIESIKGMLVDLDAELLSIKNSNNPNIVDLTSTSKDKLNQLSSLLNHKFNGVALFAGGKTDQNAVNDLTASSNVVGTKATNSYYKGDDYVEKVGASQFLTVEVGITGDNPAFQNAIAALHTAISYHGSGAEADFDLARGFIKTAQENLGKITASYSAKKDILEASNSDLEDLNKNLLPFAKDNSETDLVKASVKVQQIQTQLQASFQVFGVLAKLKLSDYL